MNDLNLSSSSEGLSSQVSALVASIDNTKNMILAAFERTVEQVSHYSVGTAQKIVNMGKDATLLVDKVVLILVQIKNHIMDIERSMKKGRLHSQNDIQHVVNALATCRNTLVEKLQANTFFKNTFGRFIEEIYQRISSVYAHAKA